MDSSVRAVEKLLGYRFQNKKLLEEALTHSSYIDSESYERLEFFGDAALGLAISKYLFIIYPEIDPGQLTLLRTVNISTERFARVAVRHRLYSYVQRRNVAALDGKVRDFTEAVQQEDDTNVYGGDVRAPKILADIVESLAAAVFRYFLEPIVTLDVLQQQPQPVTMLFELCQKERKRLDIRNRKKGKTNITSVCVDGKFIASGRADQTKQAKLNAAKAALKKLSYSTISDEMKGAKQKLQELCGKKKWPKPSYRIERESGPDHKKRFICSVQIETTEAVLSVEGDEKWRVKNAEASAASMMLQHLLETRHT
ncbi:unnamed protein product [Ilex paraguariensis]|uniref:Uncharacterized protein n=1 Tax=Ilex paraguariensis TaxID=185542 RepID=A0ABC8T9V0_9AQUA